MHRKSDDQSCGIRISVSYLLRCVHKIIFKHEYTLTARLLVLYPSLQGHFVMMVIIFFWQAGMVG